MSNIENEVESKARHPMVSLELEPSLDLACDALRDLQKQRVFCIRMQSKCDRATESFVARHLGYHSDLDPKERKKLFAEAAKLRRMVERGEDDQLSNDTHGGDVIATCAPLILLAAKGRAGFDAYRQDIEKRMRSVARELPPWGWVEGIAGFSDLGLAVIVGEAGNLSNYTKRSGKPGSGVAKLWKRMGLAVLGGVRQGGLAKSASADEWIVHGYNPARRAEVWAIGDVVLRQQWRGERDDAPAHPTGPYGEHYGRMKAVYLAREWSPLRADRAARRYMTKELLKDLWVVWKRAAQGESGHFAGDDQDYTAASPSLEDISELELVEA